MMKHPFLKLGLIAAIAAVSWAASVQKDVNVVREHSKIKKAEQEIQTSKTPYQATDKEKVSGTTHKHDTDATEDLRPNPLKHDKMGQRAIPKDDAVNPVRMEAHQVR